MAPMESVKHVWNSWGLHVLVLFSFSLQVVLLVLGDIRRRMNSGVLRAVAWSAYLLADSTAIYVLGHLSVTSRSPEHQLMVLWAPFLLLHLGGQDNITAYAIEDTRLWMRHLQALVVQGIAAAYVLYESSVVGSRLFLGRAAIIMFTVGLLKYAERVWALRCAGVTSSGKGNAYRPIRDKVDKSGWRGFLRRVAPVFFLNPLRVEAHELLDVPRDFLNGPLPSVSAYCGPRALKIGKGGLYSMVEIQLSLMHDIFYTKTGLIHGWHGILARTMWTASTAVALSLFHTDDKDGYNRVDVVVTYVLFTGALILETMWLLRSMFSSWTMVPLENYMHMHSWDWVNELLKFFRKQQKLLGSQDWRRRYWHRCMEQHDLLVLCWGNRASRCSNIAAWFQAEDWWNMRAYSWSIPIPRSVEKLVADHVDPSKRLSEASNDHIFNTRGQMALHRWGLYDGLRWSIDIELDESILVWHIATKIWLCRNRRDLDEQAKDLEKAVEALSNYMMFLLAGRSYMLPPPASRAAYVELCYWLSKPGVPYRSPEELASLLLSYGEALNDEMPQFDELFPNLHPDYKGKMGCLFGNKTLKNGSKLGATLISHHNNVEQGAPPTDIVSLLAQVWAEMLCYAGHRCSGFYHVKQLSNGGELITVAAILGHYISDVVNDDTEVKVRDWITIDAPVSSTSGNGVSHASEGV